MEKRVFAVLASFVLVGCGGGDRGSTSDGSGSLTAADTTGTDSASASGPTSDTDQTASASQSGSDTDGVKFDLGIVPDVGAPGCGVGTAPGEGMPEPYCS